MFSACSISALYKLKLLLYSSLIIFSLFANSLHIDFFRGYDVYVLICFRSISFFVHSRTSSPLVTGSCSQRISQKRYSISNIFGISMINFFLLVSIAFFRYIYYSRINRYFIYLYLIIIYENEYLLSNPPDCLVKQFFHYSLQIYMDQIPVNLISYAL